MVTIRHPETGAVVEVPESTADVLIRRSGWERCEPVERHPDGWPTDPKPATPSAKPTTTKPRRKPGEEE